MVTIVSTSLHSQSKSRSLSQLLPSRLAAEGESTRFVDLRETPLPLCDGGASFSAPAVAEVQEALLGADGVVIATPIYNFDVSAAAKNFIELCGAGLRGKTIGLLAAAGGNPSYMAPLGFLNSLMLDYRTVILPRFVYVSSSAFENGVLRDQSIVTRIDEFVRDFADLVTARRSVAVRRAVATL